MSVSARQLNAAALHAVIIADTLDSSVGSSVEIDFKNVTAFMQKIAQNSGLELKMTTFRDKDVLHSKVLSHINSLKPGSDDTVIFYYAGHGFRNKNVTSQKWPALALKDAEDDFVGLELNTVFTILKAKNSRFLLVISDSCNNVIEGINVMNTITTRTLPEKENYMTLFRKYQGSIIVSAAKPGQIALGDTSKGGLFTSKFFEVLDDALRDKNPTWEDVLKKATVRQAKQDPQYDVYDLKHIADKKTVDPVKTGDEDMHKPIEIPYTALYGNSASSGRNFKSSPGKDYILTGFNIGHGDIIDSIQPIYKKISPDGSLGFETTGPRFGGSGGSQARESKEGYVVANIWVMEVDYHGHNTIGALVIDYLKWDKGYDNAVLSRSHIYGRTGTSKWKLYNRYKGTVICGIHGSYGTYLNRLSLLVSQHGYRTASLDVKKQDTAYTVTAGDRVFIRLANFDNFGYVHVNNQIAGTVSYMVRGPFIDISRYLKQGKNTIRISVYSRGGNWSYGYRIYKNNTLLLRERCGSAGGESCTKQIAGNLKVVKEIDIIRR